MRSQPPLQTPLAENASLRQAIRRGEIEYNDEVTLRNGVSGMIRTVLFFGVVIGLFCFSHRLADAAEAETYLVGVARVDITPDYPIRLNGFGGRRAESEGVRQRIWAKAIAIGRDNQEPKILLTIDSLGIRLPMVDEVARRLAHAAQIKRENVVLTFSHSHTTPKVNGASDTIFSTPIPADHQAHIDRYTKQLTDQLTEVALLALKDRAPSQLEWAIGKVGFAINRRTAGGPVDHDLPILVVKDEQKKVRAIYVSYACHCVTLSDNQISGDWAGYAQEAIERRFPDAIALVSIGAGSDSNPDSGVTGGRGDIAALQGAQIADEVARLMQRELTPVRGALRATYKLIDLPLNDLPSKMQLEERVAQGGPIGYNASWQLARLAAGKPLATKIDYPIQTWTFGDRLSIVFLGGEVCVDYSLRLKQELDRQRLWINAYSNDFCSYIPSERLVREGGYGGGAEIVYFALPATLKAGLEDKIVRQVKSQVPRAFHVAAGTQGVAPLSPNASLRSIETHDDLKVELVASEPLVQDPVAIDFGLDGRLWVVEMVDYARAVDENFEHTGQIKCLQDTDGDGQYDKGTVFADRLRFPTEVKAWAGGVLVCDAPDILLFTDEDGDGRADSRKVLFTGFATHNPQARVNSLRLGLDNWLHGACGLFGGTITSHTGKKLELGGRDFRIKPDLGLIEPVTGTTQQGRCRNDWGDWFGCDNSTLIRHYPINDVYVRRSPLVAPPATALFVPQGDEPNRLFPQGDLVRFKLSGPAGRPTAVCGLEIYRDDLLAPEYRGNSFSCEPVNQLVHRLSLERGRSAIHGQRVRTEKETEFLRSSDRWFRPVQARTGPDGGLWIVDMYRYVIEHPQWIPENLNLFAGQGRGRIYRVLPRTKSPRTWHGLAELNDRQLAARLDSPNGTLRDMIHQELLLRQPKTVRVTLEQIVKDGLHAEARLQSLCLLDGLKLLDRDVLIGAMNDERAGVRRHAIRLTESLLIDSNDRTKMLLATLADPDSSVRLQATYSLGLTTDPDAVEKLVQLAGVADADDYLRYAVLSGICRDNLSLFVKASLKGLRNGQQIGPFVDSLLPLIARLGEQSDISNVVTSILQEKSTTDVVDVHRITQLLEAISLTGKKSNEVFDAHAAENLNSLEALSARIAIDLREPIVRRIGAIKLLAASMSVGRADVSSELLSLIVPEHPSEVQQAAIEAITHAALGGSANDLLSCIPAASPRVRSDLIGALLSRDAWASVLLDAIDEQTIAVSMIDQSSRSRLRSHAIKRISERANRLFAVSSESVRQETIDRYMAHATLGGNAIAGKIVFARTCASCHQLQGVGEKVGPDLAALSNKNISALLTAIIDPNRDIDTRYLIYTVIRRDGRSFSGMIADETSTSITLRDKDDRSYVVLRKDIDEMRSTQLSLMPDEVESTINESQMADLLAFLGITGPGAKTFVGNKPSVVPQDDKGQLTLSATTGGIYGGDIVFESPLENIGFWHGSSDHVVWQADVTRGGVFDVFLEYACHDSSAGNRLVLHGPSKPIEFQVVGTGGWDKYVRRRIGTAELKAGRQMIIVQPNGSLQGALLDLKNVLLVPKP